MLGYALRSMSQRNCIRFVSITKDKKKVWYQVQYGKLPTFCGNCGLIGHWHEKCGPGEHDVTKLEWGNFILADVGHSSSRCTTRRRTRSGMATSWAARGAPVRWRPPLPGSVPPLPGSGWLARMLRCVVLGRAGGRSAAGMDLLSGAPPLTLVVDLKMVVTSLAPRLSPPAWDADDLCLSGSGGWWSLWG